MDTARDWLEFADGGEPHVEGVAEPEQHRLIFAERSLFDRSRVCRRDRQPEKDCRC
jgi:hypothetical protein